MRLALLDPEPGFWGNGSYFGDKDILSFDVGAQVQGTRELAGRHDKTYADINVDGLFEKKLGGGSFVTAEAAYYHFNVATGGVSDSLYALLAYATPTVGVGNLQPMVRYQWEKIKDFTGHQPLEPGCWPVLPDQGPRAPAPRHLQLHESRSAQRSRLARPTRPPTPSSSGRRQSSSNVYAPEIGNRQRFIASKTNT